MGTTMLPTLMPPKDHHSWHFHQEDLEGKNFFVLKLVQDGYNDLIVDIEKISDFELQLQVDVFRKTPQEVVDTMARKIIANAR